MILSSHVGDSTMKLINEQIWYLKLFSVLTTDAIEAIIARATRTIEALSSRSTSTTNKTTTIDINFVLILDLVVACRCH